MEFQEIANFLNTMSDDKDLPRFATKSWIEVHDQSEKNYNPNKKIRIKTSMLRSDLCDFSDAYIGVEGDIIVTEQIMQKETKVLHLKTMHHLLTAFQKSMEYRLTTQET